MDKFKAVKESISIIRGIEYYCKDSPIKRGSKYYCYSPFGKEKTPSCCVYPETNSFYCFSSNTGGDIIVLVSKLYGITKIQAVEKIAQDFNIPIDTDKKDSQKAPFATKELNTENKLCTLKNNLYKFYHEMTEDFKDWKKTFEQIKEVCDPDDPCFAIALDTMKHYEVICYEFATGEVEDQLILFLKHGG